MVSVIINTKNEEKNIGLCLKSIESQTYQDLEIIVVDNYSSDATVDVSNKFRARVYNFGPERSEQKNYGASKALGGLLLFVDADMELAPEVLNSCVETVNEGFGAVVVPEESVGLGFWAKCRTLEKRMYFNDSSIEAPRFFTREVFEKSGGFTSGMVSGEDWDLREKVKKSGARIGRVVVPIYHHEGDLKFWETIRKKFYYSTKAKKYLTSNPPGLLGISTFIFRPAFLRNIRYLFIDPIHYLGMIFLKTAEFVSGMAGLVYSNLL